MTGIEIFVTISCGLVKVVLCNFDCLTAKKAAIAESTAANNPTIEIKFCAVTF